MHLIMILIRWLVGFFGGGRLAARGDLSCAPSEAGTIRFLRDSNGVYCSGVCEMKVNLMLTEFKGLLGWRPALAIVSSHRRGLLRKNPYQPDYFVVETALLSPNFPTPVPRSWG
jgi:hypothetical protein